MKVTRPLLLVASGLLVVLLIAGGMVVKVGAGENSYRQVVLFSEVLSLVLENYVDPVEANKLLNGAYEGLLSGLDANGAFLAPREVADWKAHRPEGTADPGVAVLKAGSALQVVAVRAGSPAETAGILVGDHIRTVGGRSVQELSLAQAWRLIRGAPGTTVKLDVLHVADDFRHEEVEIARVTSRVKPFTIEVKQGTAVVKIHELARLSSEDLMRELQALRTDGVSRLLLDLRNLAALDTRDAVRVAGLFSSGPLLRLRDHGGKLMETLESKGPGDVWPAGVVAVLVNGATAGGGEALARSIQTARGGLVLGESTYGLGAEPRLFELEDGSALLVSSAMWETASGQTWHGKGIEPDEPISGRGEDYKQVSADQLVRALEYLERREGAERKAA